MIKTFRIFGAGEWGLAVANHLSCLDNKLKFFFVMIISLISIMNLYFYKDLNLSFNKNIIFRKLTDLDHLSDSEDNFNIIASSSSGLQILLIVIILILNLVNQSYG